MFFEVAKVSRLKRKLNNEINSTYESLNFIFDMCEIFNSFLK